MIVIQLNYNHSFFIKKNKNTTILLIACLQSDMHLFIVHNFIFKATTHPFFTYKSQPSNADVIYIFKGT